jgi:hypothetical protein
MDVGARRGDRGATLPIVADDAAEVDDAILDNYVQARLLAVTGILVARAEMNTLFAVDVLFSRPRTKND